MARMVLMNILISSLEKDETVVVVFLDLSKAFATVDNVILLTRFEHYGIWGNALVWFSSYFTDREHFVTYNGAASSTKSVSCGVPQGPILDPLSFLVYINDQCNGCNSTLLILFDDDTNSFKRIQDRSHIETMFDKEFKILYIYGLKSTNCHWVKRKLILLISTNEKCDKSIKLPNWRWDNRWNRYTQFLGVNFDKKFTGKDHINYVACKVSRAIGMMIKVKKYLRRKALLTRYYSFVYPYLISCNLIWGATYVSYLRKRINLQDRVVRIISNAKYGDNADPLYKSLGILKLVDINKYLIARFMFWYCNNSVPELFNSYFEWI